jgi:hypothetical protein
MPGVVNIGLNLSSDRYDADDDRWLDQVADLVGELRVETGALEVNRTAVPGTKGTVDQLILTLGSAGVFTTALDVLRIWLARDKTRSVQLSYVDREGKQQRLNVTATHADKDVLAPLIAAVAGQIEATP